jgi:hypothetical protein
MVIFISSMVMDKINMSIVFTLFRTIAPERDEIAAKRDVKRTAAATTGVAVQAGSFRTGMLYKKICIVAGIPSHDGYSGLWLTIPTVKARTGTCTL